MEAGRDLVAPTSRSARPVAPSIASILSVAAFGQTPAAPPAFEVASIKPAVPINPMDVASGKLHIGMTITAGRVDIGSLSMTNLIGIAYNMKAYQVSGPSWMSTERFDILAKLPAGATSEQVPAMLQALLAERFKLAMHKDSKEQSVFALVVGKGGQKLKEAEPDPAAPEAAGGVSIGRPGAKGGVMVSAGPAGPMRMTPGPGGTMHMELQRATMGVFADMQGALRRPPGGGPDRVERELSSGGGPIDGGHHRHGPERRCDDAGGRGRRRR